MKLAALVGGLVVLGATAVHAGGPARYTIEGDNIAIDADDYHGEVPVRCDKAFALAEHEGRLHVACGSQGIVVYSLSDPLHPAFATRLLATGSCEDVAENGWCADAQESAPQEPPVARIADHAIDAASTPTWPARKRSDLGKSLMIAGGATLIVSSVVSVAVVFGTNTCTQGFIFPDCHSYSGWLPIPVAGPAIALGDNVGKPYPMNGEIAFYAIGMGINIAALATLLAGAVYQRDNDHPTARSWTITPWSVGAASGVAVSGVLF